MNGNEDDVASLATVVVRAADLGIKAGEIATASGFVIAARLSLIGAAFTNPLDANYREMGRMMPEKLFALSYSGIALIEQMGAFQRDLAAQAMDIVHLMMGGVPSAARLRGMAEDAGRRGSRAMMWPVLTGEATMTPVHRTVTSNARRLRNARRAA
ncbi:hypothetical protein [Sphingomonas profundi]|uniref:hypothetical protein n=1 Tax=Alterirhizorhabdus profundi TaxID=2681549 RepID=UPI0012E7CCE8|nr:hypothetical protein [Sphingomonas profundi]